MAGAANSTDRRMALFMQLRRKMALSFRVGVGARFTIFTVALSCVNFELKIT